MEDDEQPFTSEVVRSSSEKMMKFAARETSELGREKHLFEESICCLYAARRLIDRT